jgi:parallel beta-helix repeat protein
MRIALRTNVVVATLLTTAGAARADAVVYPTGDAATDLAALQAAVDGGGTVTLKAAGVDGVTRAFELPDDFSGMVLLHRDVAIVGEILPGARTRIHNGYAPFNNDVENINVSVQNLQFDSPIARAVWLFNVQSATLANNVVRDVQFSPDDGAGGLEIDGVTGPAGIAGNQIFNPGRLGIGVQESQAAVDIVGNQVGDPTTPLQNPRSRGIVVGADSGVVHISGNLVNTGPGGNYGWGIRVSAGFTPIRPFELTVSNNTVHVVNPAASGIRISNPAGSARVTQNEVHMDLASVDPSDPLADIGAFVINGTDHAFIAQNLVFGQTFCGLCLYGSSNCTLLKNDLSSETVPSGISDPAYQANSADVVFAYWGNADSTANHNVLVGDAPSIWDAGVGNVVTGRVASTKGGVGASVSGAHREP